MIPHRLAARDAADGRVACLGGVFVLRCSRLQLLKLQLQLVDDTAALGGSAEALALQLGDQQPQMCDHRLRAARPRLGFQARRALRGQRRPKRRDVVGDAVGHDRHGSDFTITTRFWDSPAWPPSQFAAPQPAASGRQVRCGLRQSMPSSM